MQTTASDRTSISSVQSLTADDKNKTDAGASAGTMKGYGHLLENLTLEEAFKQYHFNRRLGEVVHSFLVHGEFPSAEEGVNLLASWMVDAKQTILLGKVLSIAPAMISICREESAKSLLAIVQSGLSFSGLTLQLSGFLEQDVAKKIIPLLEQAFQANSSLTAIELPLHAYDYFGLAPLFDVLAGQTNLALSTNRAGRMRPADYAFISNLLSRNKTLRVLELRNLGDDDFDVDNVAFARGKVGDVIKEIAGQLQLERLSLNYVPEDCEAVIGELIGASHVLKDLKISLAGSTPSDALIDGFRRSTTVENVRLKVQNLEDDMLPLIAAIAQNDGSIKSLELIIVRARTDANDCHCICDLIARNRFLVSLTWRFPFDCKVDLVKFGTALGKNKRLETLELREAPESGYSDSMRPDWAKPDLIPGMTESLKSNRSLTKLVFAFSSQETNPVERDFPLLQQVLDRNRAWQQYACSDAFLVGAVDGLFATMGMPVDTATVTASFLMQSEPRVTTAALALVNKTIYQHALSARRHSHADMLSQMLPIKNAFGFHNREDMVGLLNGIIVSKQDFSIDDFSSIADSPSLGIALKKMMYRSPPDYLYLVKLFCQAAGVKKIRSMMISAFDFDDRLDGHVLSMLEQSFPPDQEHLLPLIEKELNYHSINSTAARLFIGYKIQQLKDESVDIKELASWCVENNHPAVLIAFQDIYFNEVSIDFNKYTGAFARGMMNKIPLLKNASKLYIKGLPDYEDALVLYRALAATSILKKMYIDENNCGPEFDFIMQGLSLNRGITTLLLACRMMSDAPSICGTLASLLEANSTIELINMVLFDDDSEFTDLTQLAAMDGRLNLEHLNRDDTSSDSDEAPAQ